MADFQLKGLKTKICPLSAPIIKHNAGAKQLELKGDKC